MDVVDRRILAALAADGRLTLQDLAARVHLGTSATRDRMRRLEQRGLLSGYRAVVDEAALGFPLDALVEVDLAPDGDMAAFEDGLRALPAVVEAVHATGDRDYLVRLRCAGTDDLHRTVRSLKADIGAMRTETRVILDHPVAARQRLA